MTIKEAITIESVSILPSKEDLLDILDGKQ